MKVTLELELDPKWATAEEFSKMDDAELKSFMIDCLEGFMDDAAYAGIWTFTRGPNEEFTGDIEEVR